jgi:protein ImuA
VEVSPAPPVGPDPADLHPALWRADQLGRAAGAGRPTGFAALDAVLPGGGWPAGALTELLLPHPGVGEWRLLAPALAAVQQGRAGEGPRSVMLFDPPAEPCAWTLGALGLDLRALVVVQGAAPGAPRRAPRGRAGVGAPLPGADTLWALEQALASGQVGAVLAWLPTRLPGDALRRLQLAAQAHPGLAFLFREVPARLKPSAAPLRLQLAPGGPDELLLRVLKRRGPLLAAPLRLTLPPVLSPGQQAAVLRRARAADALPVPARALVA